MNPKSLRPEVLNVYSLNGEWFNALQKKNSFKRALGLVRLRGEGQLYLLNLVDVYRIGGNLNDE